MKSAYGRGWRCCALGLAVACVGSAPVQALYSGPPQPASDVAELSGLVEHVDGQKVSGASFALLPGCHVVQPPAAVGRSSPTGATWVKFPPLHFSINMHPAHRYQVVVNEGHMDGTGAGTAMILAAETNAAGERVRTFRAFQGPGLHAACDAEAEISGVLVSSE